MSDTSDLSTDLNYIFFTPILEFQLFFDRLYYKFICKLCDYWLFFTFFISKIKLQSCPHSKTDQLTVAPTYCKHIPLYAPCLHSEQYLCMPPVCTQDRTSVCPLRPLCSTTAIQCVVKRKQTSQSFSGSF